MTTPSPDLPPILNYQRAEKAKRIASGGVRILGIGLLLVGFVLLIIFGAFMTVSPSQFRIAGIFIPSLIVTIGLILFNCSTRIRAGDRRAAWIALVLASAISLLWLANTVVVALDVRKDPPPLVVFFAVFLMFASITAGLVAVLVEMIIALRNPHIWQAPNWNG